MSAQGWRRAAGLLAGVLVALLYVLRPLLQLVGDEWRRRQAEERRRAHNELAGRLAVRPSSEVRRPMTRCERRLELEGYATVCGAPLGAGLLCPFQGQHPDCRRRP